MRLSKTHILSDEISNENDDIEGPPEGWLRKAFFYITMAPSDLQLIISEQIESIDWDSKSETIARPIGIFATVVFYVLRLMQDSVVKPAYYKNTASKNAFDLSQSPTLQSMPYLSRYTNSTIQVEKRRNAMFAKIDTAINGVLILMIVLQVRITYKFLYAEYRQYSLFDFEPKEDSPNLTKRSLTNLSKSYLQDISKKGLWSMIKYFIFIKVNKEMMERELSDKYFYTLKKWAPSKFTMQLFVHFNPINICFLSLTDVSFVSFLLVLIIWTGFRIIIQDRYEIRLVDESIISAALVDQMNKKLVKNRTSKHYQNVTTDATIKGSSFAKFEPAIERNPIFETHSLDGDLVRERYNKETLQFEDVSEDKQTNNIISN